MCHLNPGYLTMSSRPESDDDDGLEAAVDQVISAPGGHLRAPIRALLVDRLLYPSQARGQELRVDNVGTRRLETRR